MFRDGDYDDDDSDDDDGGTRVDISSWHLQRFNCTAIIRTSSSLFEL